MTIKLTGSFGPITGAMSVGDLASDYVGSLIPQMTSNTAPSGIASQSSVYTVNAACKAVQGNNNGQYLSASNAGSSAWIAYEFTSNKTVRSYDVQGGLGVAGIDRAPKNWTLEGWNGSSYDVIDTQSNQTSWIDTEFRSFSVSSPASYIKYRFNVSQSNDSSFVNVGELVLYDNP